MFARERIRSPFMLDIFSFRCFVIPAENILHHCGADRYIVQIKIMRPTNMQRATDNDGRKLNQSASPSGRPKHTTTITVLSSARSSPKPVSLTSPLQSRLSGDLSQILESRDEGAAESVQSLRWRYSRNVAPSRVALPDHPRGSTQMWSAVSSATSPQSLAQASSTKSPQVTAASVKTAPLEASAAPELLRHTNSKSYSISRSSSDADSSSPDRTAVRSNGHYTSSTTTSNSDDCGESDTSSVPELDFFSSLPSLPADDFMSPVTQQYASLSLSSPSETSFSTPSSPSSVNIPISTPIQREDSIATAMAAEDEADPTSAPPAEIDNPALDSTIPGDPHSAYKSEIELPTLDGTIPYDPRQASKPEAQTPVVAETAGNEEGDEQKGAAGIPPESFHINVKASDGESLDPGIAEDDITTFAGRRDVRDHLRSKKDRQIVSTKGTVRGFKNRVRAGIATFIDKASNKVSLDCGDCEGSWGTWRRGRRSATVLSFEEDREWDGGLGGGGVLACVCPCVRVFVWGEGGAGGGWGGGEGYCRQLHWQCIK